MTGDRLPAFFLKGVWQGLKIASYRTPVCVTRWVPCRPCAIGSTCTEHPHGRGHVRPLRERMVRTAGATETSDERVPRGGYAGTWMYAIGVLVLLGLVGWRIWQLIP